MMPADIARECQKLNTDRLVHLYEIDASEIGGVGAFRFVSSVDTSMPIVSLTRVGSIATCVTQFAHTFATGEGVRISNASESLYNGDHSVTVLDPNTFTYNMLGVPFDDAFGAYLKATRVNNTMIFDGQAYSPIAIEVSGFEWNGTGTLPTPSLQISNVNRVMLASIISLKNLVGAKFTRIRTFRKHLDDGSDPNVDMIFPKEVYRFNRKVAQNKVYVEFQLASSLDQEGVKIPGRQCLRNTCTHRYRVWDPENEVFDYSRATCPYVGTTYFDATGTVIFDPALDRCSKQIGTGCRNRFGTAPLPTRATPGIGGR